LLKYASFQVLSSTLIERDEPAPGLIRTAHRAVFSYQPRPGYLYVRSRAISSRCNDNYDEFPAQEIEAGYRSFVGKPVFVNHKNDDHRRARGVIVEAVLHKDANLDGSADTWVEVLMEVDAVRFPKLAKAIIAGHIDRTSMGVDVAYSECTVCGNKAATPLEYCAHIPALKGQRIRRTIAATGEKQDVLVAERCYGLSFFENSLLVEQPADPTAYFLGKPFVATEDQAVNSMLVTAGVGSDRSWKSGWSDDVDTDYAKQVRKRPGWVLHDEDHAQVEHGGIRASVRPTSDGERHVVNLTHDGHRIHDLNRFGNTWSTPKAAMDAAEKYIDKHRPGWRDSAPPPSEEFYAGDDAKQRWQRRHLAAKDPDYAQGGEYSRYTRVVPTGEEVAEHMKRHGRQPATYRYECKECGKRLWGSGLGIGAHNRWHGRNPSTGPSYADKGDFIEDHIKDAKLAVAENLPKHTYRFTTPDGEVHTRTTTRTYTHGLAVRNPVRRGSSDVAPEKWGVISAHNGTEQAMKSQNRWSPHFGDTKIIAVDNPRPQSHYDNATPSGSRKCEMSGQHVRSHHNDFVVPCPSCGARVKQTRKGEYASHSVSAKLAAKHALEQNDKGEHAWFRCKNDDCGFVWLGSYRSGKNRRAQAMAAHDEHLARNPHLAYNEMMAPAKVDTLRDPNCPVCGDESYNGEDCPVCGFTKPPDMFGDPDTDVAKQQDLRQERDDASNATSPASSPTGYVPPVANQSSGASGYVPPSSTGYVPPRTARRRVMAGV
jgi:hypothetical protein